MGIPPPPPGFSIIGYGGRPDPVDELIRRGFTPTNGYRTDGDMERLQRAGYHPAPGSLHRDGDATDFEPPHGMPFGEAQRVAQEVSAGWPGAKILNEGDHIHGQWPGYGRAPGTPGTDRFGLAPLPEGFELIQRGSLTGGNYNPGIGAQPSPAAPAPRPANPPQAAAHPTPLQMTDDVFSARLGAIARDPDLAPADRFRRMASLSQIAGRPIADQDLQFLAKGHGGQVAYTPGQNGQPGGAAVLNTAPQPEPTKAQQRWNPSTGYDPNLRGLNSAVRGVINNNKLSDDQVRQQAWGLLSRYGIDPAKFSGDVSVLNGLNAVLKWRAQNPGRPYKGAIDLERLPYANAAPPKAPPLQTQEQATQEYINRQQGGAFQWDGPITPSHITGRTTKDEVEAIFRGFGYSDADQRAETASLLPITGGYMALDQGVRDLSHGKPKGALGIVLGGLDFVPGGKAATGTATHVLEAQTLRRVAEAADGTVDLARAGDHLRGAVDEALTSGGRVTLHAGGKPRNIVGTDPAGRMLDDKGGTWGADTLLNDRAGRLEVHLPEASQSHHAPPPPAGSQNGDGPDDLFNQAMQSGHPEIIREAWVARELERFQHSNEEVSHIADKMKARVDERMSQLTPFERNNPAHIDRIRQEELANLGDDLDAISARTEKALRLRAEKLFPDGQAPAAGRSMSQQTGDFISGQAPPSAPALPPPGMPPRRPDYLPGFRPGEVPPPPPGFQPIDDPQLGRLRPMGQQASPEDMATAARGFQPGDILPIPGNQVETAEEAARIPTSQQLLTAPNERDELARRFLPRDGDMFAGQTRRGPLDLSQTIRRAGGLRDDGDLAAMGITNAPRKGLPFGNDIGLGNLINPNGRGLDEMTRFLHERGWFPNEAERPTTEALLDALRQEQVGGSRIFHPDDQPEVDAFHSALAERGRVETAAQERAPLVEHVGEPAGLEDMRAIDEAIPATAYEDLPKLGGTVGNINLANLETRGDIRRALQNVETRFGGFDAARRGQITHAETAALASELQMTPDDLLRRRKGQALNAEQALAARQILAKSSDELLALARKVEGGSEEDLATFHKALLRHAAIQEQVSGATAEAGRALSQFRVMARSKAVPGRVLDAVISGGGGKDRIEDAAKAIFDLQRQGADAGQINSFARDALKPKFRDKLVELYINSLLSGPQTHAVNIVSNLITQVGQVPEHVAAALLGAGRRGGRALVGKQMASDAVTFSEVGARALGMVSGVKRGLLNGAQTFATEIPSDMAAKVEHMTEHAIGGTVGRIVRVPTRALSAADEVFKGIARRSAMDGLAIRQAWSEGHRGQALRDRAAELAASPTPEMVAQAFDYGRYVTFQRPTGDVGQWVNRMKQKHPVLVLVAPFVRTPANLLKFSLERTPLAPAIKTWRQDFAAGGARRDLAISRAVVGSGIGAMAAMWAQQGLISGGGPADRHAGDLMRADGWQPYSIKVGGKWISYARLDPYSTVLGLAADLATKSDHMTNGQRDKAAAVLVGSVLRQMESKTWISGFTKLVKGVDELARGQTTDLQDWFDSTASGAAVPTLLSQVAHTMDPTRRGTKDFAALPDWADSTASRIMSRVPGLSDNLPAKTDVFGQPETGEGGAGPDILSPLWVSTPKNDPVPREMLRLGVPIGEVRRVVQGNRLGLDEFQGYKAKAGQYIHEGLTQAVNSPAWRSMDDKEQRRWSKEILRDARAAARDDLGLTGNVDEDGGAVGAIPPPPPGFKTVPPPRGFQLRR
jgi:hypothetical protein